MSHAGSTDANWLDRLDVAAIVACDRHALHRWRTAACPLLGRRLRAKPDPRNRRAFLYWRPDAEQIRAARVPLPDEFDQDGASWLWAQLVPQRFGLNLMTLRKYARRACPLLGGAQLQRQLRFGSVDRRRSVPRVYYRIDQLAQLRGAKAQGRGGPDPEWAGYVEAARLVSCVPATLYRWAGKRGCPALGGRPLRTKAAPRVGSTRRQTTLFWRADLAAIARVRDGQAPRDADEPVSSSAAKARFGFSLSNLKDWSTRGCTWLNGRKLQRIPMQAICDRRTGRMCSQWGYLLSELQVVDERRRAGSSPALTHTDAEGTWLPVRVAAPRYQTNETSLRDWRRAGCTYLGGRRLRAKMIPLKLDRNGHGSRCWGYHQDDLDRIAAARAGTPMPACGEPPISPTPSNRSVALSGYTVTEASKLTDIATGTICRAAERNAFHHSGQGRDRRIDPTTFKDWVLERARAGGRESEAAVLRKFESVRD